MKQASLPELHRRIVEAAGKSIFSSYIRDVEVEVGDEAQEGFLRVTLHLTEPNEQLDWDKVEPLVRAIEDVTADIDERHPSVRFALAS